MNRDDIIRMAREVWGDDSGKPWHESAVTHLEAFANLVAAAEREKVANWMMTACYATGHGDTTEDLLRELAWQADERIVKAAAAEREACAVACDKLGDEYADANAADCAFAIRERGAP